MNQKRTEEVSAYKGLTLGVLVSLVSGSLAFLAYGLCWNGGQLSVLLGLQLLLGSVPFILTLHANRLRRCFQEAHEWRRPEWGENVENPYLLEFNQIKIVHFLLLGLVPIILIAFFIVSMMWSSMGDSGYKYIPETYSLVVAILCMSGSILCLIFARSYDAVEKEELPEAEGLSASMWESSWLLGISAVGLMLSQVNDWHSYMEPMMYWAFSWWLLSVSLEHVIRFILGWMTVRGTQSEFTSPVMVFLRYMVFVKGNPLHSLFFTIESQWGVSFRSSWAIRFVARATVPSILMVLFLSWGLSCLYVVQLHEQGVRRDFGKVCTTPLGPGLHLKYPWPFGSITAYPVKQIKALPLGFEQGTSSQGGVMATSYLWNKKHEKEFELPLGKNATESVAVNAIVFYKIREDARGFLDYVLQSQTPDTMIEDYAYQCLYEFTRTETLDAILVGQRDVFADRLHKDLQSHLDRERIGVEVVDVAILNLHPPVEAAESFLDVISAEIESRRDVVVAQRAKETQVFNAQRRSEEKVSQAKKSASREVANAGAQTAGSVAAGISYKVNPDCFKWRYQLDNLRDMLKNKRLALVDESVEVFFDMQKTQEPQTSRDILMQAQ